MAIETFDFPCPICGKSVFTLPFKPGVTHRVVCPSCHTPSYVHVTKKGAVIVLREGEYENKKCKNCNGTGLCPTCKGTGQIPGFIVRKEECGVCNGTGVCPKCGGEGLIL
jgi:DnaJ-class molecular chaperone